MKKILSFILLVLVSITLTACDKEPAVVEVEDYVEVYYLNDFHGALLPSDDQLGISHIANLINTKKEETP